ncbi:MAG TPA: PEP-CTERM sorting domain-containing protein [Gemmatales bacterium]|nr:PEP-CTERM sorting domain-containing protein [Gemmatales bacterium]
MRKIIPSLFVLLFAVGAVNAQNFLVYDNLASPSTATAGSSVTDLAAIWGDRVSATQVGWLNQVQCTIFNSSTGNTNPILTTTLIMSLFPAATFDATNFANNTPFLSFNVNVNFGTGLAAGFFSVLTIDTSSLNFFLPTTNIMIAQQLSNITGGSTRAGVAFFSTDNVGSQYAANDNHYRSSTINASGYYTIGTGNNRIGYSLSVAVPEPATYALMGLSGLISVGAFVRFRRRNKLAMDQKLSALSK